MKIDAERFRCERCGACCSVPGYVALEPGEAEAMAAFLGMDVYAFTERYTTLAASRSVLSLTELEDGRCVFLEDDLTCRVQPVKPAQCKGFPFDWQSRALLARCAGIRAMVGGRGKGGAA